MNGTILLNYDVNLSKVEEEEKTRFLHCLLDQMGVPIKDFWDTDDTLTVEQKIKLGGILSTYNVNIFDDHEGNLEVYLEDELIGSWNKCTYKLKRDLSVRDPKKRLYFEMEIKYWSIFDDTPENEN